MSSTWHEIVNKWLFPNYKIAFLCGKHSLKQPQTMFYTRQSSHKFHF